MSLETQIAALIQSSNNLADIVAQKIAGIDQKVDEATQAVPDAIRNLSSATYYIDAENGDDNNSGLNGKNAFKTFAPLRDLIVSGSYTTVGLREGQDHLHEGPSAVVAQTGTILFERWGNTNGVANPRIVSRPYINSSGVYAGQFFTARTGAAIFSFVDIISESPNDGTPESAFSGFVYGYRSSVELFFHESNIELKNRPLVARAAAGQTNVSLNLFGGGLVLNERNSSEQLIHTEGSFPPFRISVSSGFALPVGVQWADVLPLNGDGFNALSNISLV
ncbi:hypothetical protein HAPgp17 [Halomonas phage phiHAP-1]|uniref:Uncharacterized protein n=1 Tax=Halomonas phage phiHAP-1 (isolate -/Gulf of Mexico/-/2001) TaxID=1283337 RepID=B0ZSG5_BPHA1|nr:hypothetical protein HAPgp17 [Halomonas phage phiHAP-1]ABY90385.1 hypothetical protein HAPgp17 [Halomonas phage phiHAP-1]